MKNLTNKCLNLFLVAFSFVLAAPRATSEENIKQAFRLNLAGRDAEQIRQSLDAVVKTQPISGIFPGPIEKKWTFGVIRIRDINYNFKASIPSLALTDSGIAMTLKVSGFNGSIRRIDLNNDNSSYCQGIQLNSRGKDIDVQIVLNANVNNTGDVNLAVTSSKVTLTRKNFNVNKPAYCKVKGGMSGIVRWLLPHIAEGYRKTIAKNVGDAIGKRIQDTGMAYSPYLSMNITLPVQKDPLRKFYASLSITPQNIVINKTHFAGWFSSDITFDPDFGLDQNELDGRQPWPDDMTHLAISWDFLNGVLREANNKGIISGLIKSNLLLAGLFESKFWIPMWRDVATDSSIAKQVEYELDSAASLTWANGADAQNASILFKDLRVRIKSQETVLAKLHIDGRINVRMDLTEKSANKFSAIVSSIDIGNVAVDGQEGYLANKPLSTTGIHQVAKQFEDLITSIPYAYRRFIDLKIPDLHIGDKRLGIRAVQFHDQGVLIPVGLSSQWVFTELAESPFR